MIDFNLCCDGPGGCPPRHQLADPRPGDRAQRLGQPQDVGGRQRQQHEQGLGRHVAARVAEDFGDHLLESSIPRTTRLSEMALRGKPAVIYDRRSVGSRAYFDLARSHPAAPR